jgi:hypothetical protein
VRLPLYIHFPSHYTAQFELDVIAFLQGKNGVYSCVCMCSHIQSSLLCLLSRCVCNNHKYLCTHSHAYIDQGLLKQEDADALDGSIARIHFRCVACDSVSSKLAGPESKRMHTHNQMVDAHVHRMVDETETGTCVYVHDLCSAPASLDVCVWQTTLGCTLGVSYYLNMSSTHTHAYIYI